MSILLLAHAAVDNGDGGRGEARRLPLDFHKKLAVAFVRLCVSRFSPNRACDEGVLADV